MRSRSVYPTHHSLCVVDMLIGSFRYALIENWTAGHISRITRDSFVPWRHMRGQGIAVFDTTVVLMQDAVE